MGDTPVLAITDTVLATTARGLLMLSQLPLLRPRLMPIPTTDTTAMDTDTVLDMPVTATVLDTTDTVLDTTARGPLSPPPSPPLPPPLRLIPTTDTTATDTDTVLDMPVTDTVLATTDTTDKCPADSSHRKTSLGITSSSSEKMDRSVWFDPHQCYQFQCHQASPS